MYILKIFFNVNYLFFIKCYWLCLFGFFIFKLKFGFLIVFYMVMGFLEEKVFFDVIFVIFFCMWCCFIVFVMFKIFMRLGFF